MEIPVASIFKIEDVTLCHIPKKNNLKSEEEFNNLILVPLVFILIVMYTLYSSMNAVSEEHLMKIGL